MPTISLRVTEAQKIDLEFRSEGNVSDYIKQQLFGQKESASEVISRLDKLLERPVTEHQAAGRDRYIEAMLIEVLLILRQVSKADAQKVAGGEIRRLGLEPWSAELAQEREEQSHE
ncbi:hypothetical protein EA888_23470 [Salmonella enterica]|nr:hypothetical protein [Salmonella enterica]MLD13130.1 hypothetical protein [Salmonella enterica]